MTPQPLPTCCLDLDIAAVFLALPTLMDSAGQEFYAAHGLGEITLAELQLITLEDKGVINGEHTIKIRHRCRQLLDDGRCRIYADRPQICRDFDCATRSDCPCGKRGVMGPVEPPAEAEPDSSSTPAEPLK